MTREQCVTSPVAQSQGSRTSATRGLAVFAASLDGCVCGLWLASCEKGRVPCAGRARGFRAHTVLVLSPKTGSLEGMWGASRATGWKGPAALRECLQQSGSPPAGHV